MPQAQEFETPSAAYTKESWLLAAYTNELEDSNVPHTQTPGDASTGESLPPNYPKISDLLPGEIYTEEW